MNPETLCLDQRKPGDPTEDPGHPVDPSPIRSKPDATTACHTYLHPDVRMDCSSRGESLDDGRKQTRRRPRQAQNPRLICGVVFLVHLIPN